MLISIVPVPKVYQAFFDLSQDETHEKAENVTLKSDQSAKCYIQYNNIRLCVWEVGRNQDTHARQTPDCDRKITHPLGDRSSILRSSILFDARCESRGQALNGKTGINHRNRISEIRPVRLSLCSAPVDLQVVFPTGRDLRVAVQIQHLRPVAEFHRG